MRYSFIMIGLFWALSIAPAQDEIDDQTARHLTEIYSKVLGATQWDLGPLEGKFIKLPDRSNISTYYATSEGRANNGRDYIIDSSLYLSIDAKTMMVTNIVNKVLLKYLKDTTTQRQSIPIFTIEKAVQTAKEYLKIFGVKLPADCMLAEVAFDKNYPSRWEVRWKRYAGGYPYDEFVEPYAEYVVVIFHETLGLSSYGSRITTPLPKSLEIKVSRDEAIIKASKYVPVVLRTPYYRQGRADGFVVSGLNSCELKVAAPNWLLDSKRAIWTREKPAEENRLCWVVCFKTVDSKAEERGNRNKDSKPFKIIPPEILIYIDAATGECVGANFT